MLSVERGGRALLEPLPELPTALADAGACTARNRVILFGGTSEGVQATADIVHYDIRFGTYEVVQKALPSPRIHVAAASVAGQALCFGGGFVGRTLGLPDQGFHDAFRYNPATRALTPLPWALPHPMMGSIAVSTEDAVLLFGGLFPGGHARCNHRIDAHTGAMTSIAPFPIGCSGGAGVFDGDSVFLFGGLMGENVVDTIWRYDPASDRLALLKTRLPKPLTQLSAAYHDGSIFLFGGWNGERGSAHKVYDHILRFDVATEKLTRLKIRLPSPCAHMAAAVVDDSILLFGGGAGIPSGTLLSSKAYRFCYEHAEGGGESDNAEVLIGGRFRPLKKLGEGAFGSVLLATDVQLDAKVALKRIRRVPGDEEGRRAFLQEAKLIRRAEHPNVVTLYDVLQDNSGFYLVMQYVEGGPLSDAPERRPPAEVCNTIAAPLLRALAAAHSVGVVHRDLKPANILLSRNGELKVTDFGLSKLVGVRGPLSITGQLVGTPVYMSPEQATGCVDVDARSDLYSAAVILFELLTGSYYLGESSRDLANPVAIATGPPELHLLPEEYPRLRQFFERALAKSPTDRYGSAVEMLEAFADAVR